MGVSSERMMMMMMMCKSDGRRRSDIYSIPLPTILLLLLVPFASATTFPKVTDSGSPGYEAAFKYDLRFHFFSRHRSMEPVMAYGRAK